MADEQRIEQKLFESGVIEKAKAWRQHIHANPELKYEEVATSQFIADILEEAGIEVERDWAQTGVVGILKKGNGTKSLGLRADIDALPIVEETGVDYASTTEGLMHACGHDGHTAMLLGAAVYLAEHGKFDGTVYFLFQPAEEGGAGAKAMVDEGLFEKFQIDEVYGIHNWPGSPLGDITINDGAMMASVDSFDINVRGVGTHAAMPNMGKDAIVAASEIVGDLQNVVARHLAPTESAVLSITAFNAGNVYNVIPEHVNLKGTVRALEEDVRVRVRDKLHQRVRDLAIVHECTAEVIYNEIYPPTINHAESAQSARSIASQVFGDDRVHSDVPASMAAEDFAFMLNAKTGAYIWLGVDEPGRPTESLHSPRFDFNDNALPTGIGLWVSLTESKLA